jgi:Na+/H+-dicarboxylate symporter
MVVAPLIFAVDAFVDMFRTSTNVMGDPVGAVVISRLTGRMHARAGPDLA